MTYTPAPPQAQPPSAAALAGSHYWQPKPRSGRKNTLGLIALIVAIVGFVFACIPGALIVGWVLLPTAFVLGIVAVCLKGSKWQAVTAIVLSIVGTIVGIAVFLIVVNDAFDDAFGSSDSRTNDTSTSVEEANETAGAGESAEDTDAATEPAGTREDPLPLGTEITNDEWKVTVNSVTLNVADAIAAESQFNDPAEPGSEYVLINYTVTYVGDDPEGAMPAWVSIDFVTADGVTVDNLRTLLVVPDAFDSLSILYNGGTATGNKALQVPSPVDGVLAVDPGMLADTVFVALD